MKKRWAEAATAPSINVTTSEQVPMLADVSVSASLSDSLGGVSVFALCLECNRFRS